MAHTSWRVARGWVLATAVILVVTLAPFEFSADEEIVAMKLSRVSPNPFVNTWGRGPLPAIGTALNVVLFVPFGLTVARALARPGRRGWTVVAIVSAAGLALSLAVESAQAFTRYRIPSSTDVLTNAIGASAGAAIVVRRSARRDDT
ncbi:MAG: VanZ family protein [Acidobacteria bacterium]|nr:VanZ family protein [Acidobacteriota bacterium]